MRLAGAKNYRDYSLKILKTCKKKPISFEVFADNFDDMLKQAYEINSWGNNVYVKIPVVNSNGAFTGPVIKELSNKGIKLNITAVYTAKQTKKILKKIDKKTKVIGLSGGQGSGKSTITGILKFILRSNIFRFLYSLLPKSFALKVAKRISYERKDSHKVNHKKLERIHSELIQFSRSKWNEGCDIVIMGHYHHSFNFNEGQKQLIILDDCCDQKFNYAKYDSDSISVESL